MAEAVAQIEQRADIPRLAFVGGDDPGLRRDAVRDGISARGGIAGQQRGAVRLAPGKEVRIVDQAIFDDFGIARTEFAAGRVVSVAGSITTSAGW